MSKQNNNHSRVCKRFNTDFWGHAALSKKKSKTLMFFFKLYNSNYQYKYLLKNRKFFIKKSFYNPIKSTNLDFIKINKNTQKIKVKHYLNRLKLKKFYGGLKEKQFRNIFNKMQTNSHLIGSSFFLLLESRLDIILFRLNIFNSIFSARQYINHKHVYINGKVIQKHGHRLNIGDIIDFNILINNKINFYYLLKNKLKIHNILANYPSYLEVNYKLNRAILINLPKKENVPYTFEININSTLYNYL